MLAMARGAHPRADPRCEEYLIRQLGKNIGAEEQ
jgi:hypothetical protein